MTWSITNPSVDLSTSIDSAFLITLISTETTLVGLLLESKLYA